MTYLSFDIEATGLRENDLIIEFGMVPVCSRSKKIFSSHSYHSYIKCPSFEKLKPNLDQWVIDNNKDLITKSNKIGISTEDLKSDLINYFKSKEVKDIFDFPNNQITLLGKSLNAIDLPFLNRDLGWEFMREYFNHQVLDVSSLVLGMIDMGHLPEDCRSGSKLSNYLNLGEVDHTALEDAILTAKIYLKLLEINGIKEA